MMYTRGLYNTKSENKSSLSDYNDWYILVKRFITVPNTAVIQTTTNNRNKKIIISQTCARYTNCISGITG